MQFAGMKMEALLLQPKNHSQVRRLED